MSDRIVVLDGYTLNPGDLDWSAFESLGELTVHDRSGELAAERARGAAFVLTNKERITAELLAGSPETRYVGVLATGTNVVDLEACNRHGVTVTNVPGYGTASVAQHVFAMLLELTNRVAAHSAAVHEGQWSRSPDFCFTLGPLTELSGKTLGIVGLGTIGRQVARIGHAFGMKIAAAHQRSMANIEIHGIPIRWLPVDDLFAEADVITLHCPLTTDTENLVNAARIERMKRTALLVNTGRGPLIDGPALADALQAKRIAGAALDVLNAEPPPEADPLLSAPNCLITPHIAWATREARAQLMQTAAENLAAFQAGTPQNVVTG